MPQPIVLPYQRQSNPFAQMLPALFGNIAQQYVSAHLQQQMLPDAYGYMGEGRNRMFVGTRGNKIMTAKPAPEDLTPSGFQLTESGLHYWDPAQNRIVTRPDITKDPNIHITTSTNEKGDKTIIGTNKRTGKQRFQVTYPGIGKPGKSGTNVYLGQKGIEALNRELAKNFAEYNKTARQANQTLYQLMATKNIFDQGINTGKGAGILTYIGNVLGSRFGWKGDASQRAARTEAFIANMGRQVAQIIKDFGAGTGLSDADRQYAERIAGGDVEMTPEAIEWLLNTAEYGYKNLIHHYNEDARRIMKKVGAENLIMDKLTISFPGITEFKPNALPTFPDKTTFESPESRKKGQENAEDVDFDYELDDEGNLIRTR